VLGYALKGFPLQTSGFHLISPQVFRVYPLGC